MSITKESVVWCDECGERGIIPDRNGEEARKFASNKGWLHVIHTGFDVCPSCIKANYNYSSLSSLRVSGAPI